MILNIERLAEVKQQNDIDTKYLAKAATIKFPTLIKIEKGEIKPTDKTIKRIAEALGVDVRCIATEKKAEDVEAVEVDNKVTVSDDINVVESSDSAIFASENVIKKESFLLINATGKLGARNDAIVRQDCFTGIRKGYSGKNIIFNAVLEIGKPSVFFENFDTEAEQNKRWLEIVEFFTGGENHDDKN